MPDEIIGDLIEAGADVVDDGLELAASSRRDGCAPIIVALIIIAVVVVIIVAIDLSQ